MSVAVAIPVQPASGHSGLSAVAPTEGCTQLWMATRINYICDRYRVCKPLHRDVSEPVPLPGGGCTTFVIGRFLSDVAEHFLQGRARALGRPHRTAEHDLRCRP